MYNSNNYQNLGYSISRICVCDLRPKPRASSRSSTFFDHKIV